MSTPDALARAVTQMGIDSLGTLPSCGSTDSLTTASATTRRAYGRGVLGATHYPATLGQSGLLVC